MSTKARPTQSNVNTAYGKLNKEQRDTIENLASKTASTFTFANKETHDKFTTDEKTYFDAITELIPRDKEDIREE